MNLASWHDVVWAVLDVETTGFSTAFDAIVEVAVVRMYQGHVVDRWSSLVNPGRSVPSGARKVHGLDGYDLHRAPRFIDIIPALAAHTRGAVPVAYGTLDRRMLIAEAARLGLADLPLTVLAEDPWINPLYWVRRVDRFDKKAESNKLVDACARWDVPLVGAHRAVNDAEATGGLLWKMAPYIGTCTVSEVLRRQLKDGRSNQDAPGT